MFYSRELKALCMGHQVSTARHAAACTADVQAQGAVQAPILRSMDSSMGLHAVARMRVDASRRLAVTFP